jgi:hypothetical protein
MGFVFQSKSHSKSTIYGISWGGEIWIDSPSSHFLGFREQGTQVFKNRATDINEGDITVLLILRIPPNFFFPGA